MMYLGQGIKACLLLLLPSSIPVLALSTPTTVFTLPGPIAPASWFESLAVRPNGLILATRGDAPEIWQIDPATGEGVLLVSVTGAFNLTGIAQVTMASHHQQRPHAQTAGETYVFGSAHIPSPNQVEPGSAKVWTLQFPASTTTTNNNKNTPNDTPPIVSLLTALPTAGFINGIASWGANRILLSDTLAAAIYLMDVRTGAYTTPLTNLTGVNGIQTAPGYVYRADHAASALSRIPVDSDAVATGPAEVLASEQPVDDFALVVDGDGSGAGRAYVAALYENRVVEVVFGPAGSPGTGTKRVVVEDVSGTGTGFVSVAVLGRRAEDAGLLYVAVGQGGGSAGRCEG
ncbi:uncharacterized protein B0H64DRAFT_381626 [Chaetomium fimeti]|uniref:Uncharacterized protein n=1 Tax=Chaetomium fimeti TaxID=1854472 RepID=A0AAE0HRZ5_9PEZI|nr:hypothetical protein B0H64DRAFT_381626 [Chaetomium fimeti]